ncbi:MAG: hypothetical protein ACHQ5A_06685 [Opitutales bacterium]
MNIHTNTLTKVVLATVVLSALCFALLTKINADYMSMLGIGASYLAALGLMGMAALDNSRTKRLN